MDLIGQHFGEWTVLSDAGVNSDRRKTLLCRCVCGVEKKVEKRNLLRNRSRSCFKCCFTWSDENIGARIRNAKRRAKQLERTPFWSDLEQIRKFYMNCPQGMTVDHIIPLRGKLVSGLHVSNNLQYLSLGDNSAKRNFFSPLVVQYA